MNTSFGVDTSRSKQRARGTPLQNFMHYLVGASIPFTAGEPLRLKEYAADIFGWIAVVAVAAVFVVLCFRGFEYIVHLR